MRCSTRPATWAPRCSSTGRSPSTKRRGREARPPPPGRGGRAGARAVELARHYAGAVGSAALGAAALPRPHVRPPRARLVRAPEQPCTVEAAGAASSGSSTSSGSAASRSAASRSAGWSRWSSRSRRPSASSGSSSPARPHTSGRPSRGRACASRPRRRVGGDRDRVVVRRWFTQELAQDEPDTVARFRAMLTATRRRATRVLRGARAWDARADRGDRGPVLVVAGAEDGDARRARRGSSLPDPGARLRSSSMRPTSRTQSAQAAFRAPCSNISDRRWQRDGRRHEDEARGARGRARRRAIANATEFTADFQDLVTRYAWGEIWSRPGLDRRTRSCIT